MQPMITHGQGGGEKLWDLGTTQRTPLIISEDAKQ